MPEGESKFKGTSMWKDYVAGGRDKRPKEEREQPELDSGVNPLSGRN